MSSEVLRLRRALSGSVMLLGLAARARAEAPAAAPAPAAGPPERVRISYALGSDCPPVEQFEKELDERLGVGWKADPAELARSITISEIAGDQNRILELDYQDDEGRKVSRTVSAATCSEALAVMAVITAVALDAQVRPVATASEPSAAPSGTPEAPSSPPATTANQTPTPIAPSPRSGPTLVHEAGVRLSVAAGFGSGPAFGLGGEWGMLARAGWALRAGADVRDTGSVPALDGRARYRVLTARVDLCPIRIPLTSALSLPLCAGLEGGVLWAEGVLAPPAVTFTQPSYVGWLAAVVSPRLRLSSEQVFAELVPDLRVPFARPTFVFTNPDRAVYGVPTLAFGGSLTAGLRFR
jgi:hypothetical protein